VKFERKAMLHNIGYVLGELAMTTHSVHGPKGQDIQGSFTNRTLYKGKIEEAIHFSNTPPLSNSRWINHIEFGKKKTMLSLSMGLGKSTS
jgi:hypothetical protein